MADKTYNDVKQWKIIPLNMINLEYASGLHLFNNLEQGSTFAFKSLPSGAKTNDGLTRIVGFAFEANIVILQNNLGDMAYSIQTITNEIPTKLFFDFGGLDEQPNSEHIYYNHTAGMLTVASGNVQGLEINHVSEDGIFLTLNIKGHLSKNLTDPLNNKWATLFEQIWSTT